MPISNKLEQWRESKDNLKQALQQMHIQYYSIAAKLLKFNLHLNPDDPFSNYLLSVCLANVGQS